jgi:plasmid maintenance system antidote protein VapI
MNDSQHPGLALASVLKVSRVAPADFAMDLGVDEPFLNRIIEGKEDIDFSCSARINGCLDEGTQQRWDEHQKAHNAWKKSQKAT